MEKTIYLDHASTTYVAPEVASAMQEYFEKNYANPGSLHDPGLKAKFNLDNARISVAKIISCSTEEIVFTGGGTESINLAIKGLAFLKGKGHIITSKIEHSAVLNSCRYLEKKGFEVSYMDVDRYGLVSPADIKNAIRKDTILVSIMYANNEIGTIQPIEEISKITKEHNIPFHIDACQAAGSLELDVNKLGADLMSLNGSKIYGPKGIGILYKRKGIELEPLIHGGDQEFGLRGGTENIPGIIGFAKALELAQHNREKESKHLSALRDYLISGILNSIPGSFLNGHPTQRLPNNANISFLDVEGESILLHLSKKGIYVSTGSACTSKKLEISHVLDAIGLNHDAAHGSIRFTLGKLTTKEDIDYTLETLPKVITLLRKLSPVHLELNQIIKTQ